MESENVQFRCYHSVPSGYQYYLSGDAEGKLADGEAVRTKIRPAENKYYDREMLSESIAEFYWQSPDVFSLDFYHPDHAPTSRKSAKPTGLNNVYYSTKDKEFFYVQVERNDGRNETIFDTRLGPLRFSQGNVTVISTLLPSKHFYGIKG